MKTFKLIISFATSFVAASALVTAAVTPQVIYNFDGNDPFFTTSNNSFFATSGVDDRAYIFFGTFDALPTATSTAEQINNDFNQLGLSSDNPYSGHSFSSSVDEADFQNQRGYLVVANNSNLGLATEMAIVSNSSISDWTFAADLSGSPTTQQIFPDDINSSTTGSELILGSYGLAGTNQTIQLQTLAAVPEPSSIALLGLSAAAFIIRRRK